MGSVKGAELQEFIDRYNDAWNAHEVNAIVAMHTDDFGLPEPRHRRRERGPRAARLRGPAHLLRLPRPQLRGPPPLHPGAPRRPGVDSWRHSRMHDDPWRRQG